MFLCVCMREKDNVKGSLTDQRNAVTSPEKKLIRSNCYVALTQGREVIRRTIHTAAQRKKVTVSHFFFSVLRGA